MAIFKLKSWKCNSQHYMTLAAVLLLVAFLLLFFLPAAYRRIALHACHIQPTYTHLTTQVLSPEIIKAICGVCACQTQHYGPFVGYRNTSHIFPPHFNNAWPTDSTIFVQKYYWVSGKHTLYWNNMSQIKNLILSVNYRAIKKWFHCWFSLLSV